MSSAHIEPGVVGHRPSAPPAGTASESERGPKRRKGRKSDLPAALAFLTPSVIGVALFTLFPTVLAVVTSFFHWPTFGDVTPAGLSNYAALFAPGSGFPVSLLNSLLFTVIIVPVNLILTLAVAFWIASSKHPQVYRVAFFLPVVTPSVATALIWQLLYQPDGVLSWLGSLVGIQTPSFLGNSSTALASVAVVILWNGFGYNTLIFSAAIDQLPNDLIDASKVDGAGRLRTLLSVKLPLITPAIFFAMILTLIQALQVFNEPFVMTQGGPGSATTTVVMNIYQTAFSGGQLGAAAAPAMVLFIIILIVTAAQWIGQRKWVNYDL